jgi:hypothetical protein
MLIEQINSTTRPKPMESEHNGHLDHNAQPLIAMDNLGTTRTILTQKLSSSGQAIIIQAILADKEECTEELT